MNKTDSLFTPSNEAILSGSEIQIYILNESTEMPETKMARFFLKMWHGEKFPIKIRNY